MNSHRDNIARLETAIQFLDLARQHNDRGNPMEVAKYLVKAEECVRLVVNGPPLDRLSTIEAIGITDDRAARAL